MKYFFWIAFAVFLAASIPHVAYFFASFEPTEGPEGVWWWIVSYAIAISIDVTVYLLSWTAFQRYRRYRTPKAVWQHWLLIIMCTVFSWIVNWAYAKQFHSPSMLSSAESTAPWLIQVFPFMASAFPLLGIVYTMMAETVSETSAEEKGKGTIQLTALAELAKQTNLPLNTLRRALTAGNTRLNATALLVQGTHESNETSSKPTAAVAEVAKITEEPVSASKENTSEQPITGQIVAIDQSTIQTATSAPRSASESSGTPDKLQMTIEALKNNPDITDELLAERLSLKRPASARFWRLKAIEILNMSQDDEPTGKNPAIRKTESWATAGMNGKH